MNYTYDWAWDGQEQESSPQFRRWYKKWLQGASAILDEPIDAADDRQLDQTKDLIYQVFNDLGDGVWAYTDDGSIVGIRDIRDDGHKASSDELWAVIKNAWLSTRQSPHIENTGSSEEERSQLSEMFALLVHRGRLLEMTKSAHELRQGFQEYSEAARQSYGNKLANLVLTEQMAARLNDLLGAAIYNVPAYTAIGIGTYAEYKSRGRLAIPKDVLATYYELVATSDVWVRSSAVYSEDGERTGAGIYESVCVSRGSGTEELVSAVRAVYESVESQRAIDYRTSIGVDDEMMGIVVQAAASDSQYAQTVTGNSAERGGVDRVEVVRYLDSGGQVRCSFVKQGLAKQIARGARGQTNWEERAQDYDVMWFMPDRNKLTDLGGYLQAAIALYFAQIVYDRPAQQESVLDCWHCSLVQTRPLPYDAYAKTVDFRGFPDQMPLHTGRAQGVCAGLRGRPLELMSCVGQDAETDSPYHIIVDSNFTLGDVVCQEWARKAIAGAQSVIVLKPVNYYSNSGGGHIETLCDELNKPIAFYDPDMEAGSPHAHYDALMAIEELVVYMGDGQARVYSGQDV